MAKIKVTQIRSTIDRGEKQKRTMEALGLHHMHASRVHEESEAVKGMIRVVAHLVGDVPLGPDDIAPATVLHIGHVQAEPGVLAVPLQGRTVRLEYRAGRLPVERRCADGNAATSAESSCWRVSLIATRAGDRFRFFLYAFRPV